MVIGFFQFFTHGSMPFTTMGARNTVPSKIARIVPFGLFHISFKLYSVIRAAFGVLVAHLTATPYFFDVFSVSTDTWFLVSFFFSFPRTFLSVFYVNNCLLSVN